MYPPSSIFKEQFTIYIPECVIFQGGLISYKKNIFDWLENAKKDIKAPAVIQIIDQYQQTIKKL